MNRVNVVFTSFLIMFAACCSFSHAMDGPTSPIPNDPQDGTYSDALMVLLEATWAQNQGDIMTSLQMDYPDVFDMTSSASDLVQANLVPAVIVAVTTVAAVDYGLSDLLDVYGDNVGISTITYSVPLTPIYDGTVYPFLFPIEVSVGGSVQNSVDHPTLYTPIISLNW